ncbi:hypothetical protein [Synechococcus sp. CS-1328]|uniref:hypothetical protein n=1 Tax=Synechococcus sp. CS-1328 TaxID=2847976 RepID=UPI00223C2364|nr:hypothetical protein [Synechococcus sp. CS-1328]
MKLSSPEELVTRLVPPQQGDPLLLGLRNLYIVPTRFGWLWLSGGALLLIVAIQTQRNGPLLLSYLMLGLMLLALHLTHFNLQGLELRCGDPAAGFAGTPLAYPLIARSRHRREGLQISWQPASHGSPAAAPLMLTLRPGEQSLALPWIPPHRGWQRPGRLKLVSTAPLGLFRCWSRWEPPRAQLIYPRRRPGPVASLPVERSEDGPTSQSRWEREGSEQWRDLRPHRPEDGSSRLAWKPFAQGRGQLTKQFSAEAGEPLCLAPAVGLPREQALEHLSERIWQLGHQEAVYGLELPGLRLEPGSGPSHREACLRALATSP